MVHCTCRLGTLYGTLYQCIRLVGISLLSLWFLLPPGTASAENPFHIKVVDRETNRGVPLVELETVHHLKYVTDNAGIAVIDAAELQNQEVFFHIKSHGYTFPEDGFGYQGKRIRIVAGGSVTLAMDRTNIAERLCRLTGAGLYAESIRAGKRAPIAQPLLNARTMGSDSAHVAEFGGKLFWIWGDTHRIGYPLGNFQVTAATSEPGRDPDQGIDYNYFRDEKGFAKKMADFPGEGPTWLDALVTLTDQEGKERLVASYVKVKPPLAVYERGLCEFDPGKEKFNPLLKLPMDGSPIPSGHPFRHQGFLYFGNALPDLRIPDRYESWKDPSTWEKLKPAPKTLKSSPTEKRIVIHRGAVSWSPFLNRWTFVFTEKKGESSYLGEIWYSESETPEGPWSEAVKILSHDRYTFYNPLQHPHFSEPDPRFLYFEGTYTRTFSGNPVATPRYDYNQILYRLDLSDERLRRK